MCIRDRIGYAYNVSRQLGFVNGADVLCPDSFCPLRRRACAAVKELCKQSLARFLQARRYVYTPSETKNYVKNNWHGSCIL